MARGTLHSPKPKNERHRRGNPAHNVVEIVPDDVVRGPELDELTLSSDWSVYTLKWYETWRKSPQAQLFENTDWQRLGMLAFIVERFQLRPAASAMMEIRMSEERLGATVTDRLRARMLVVHPDDDEETGRQLASVANLPDHFNDRLGAE